MKEGKTREDLELSLIQPTLDVKRKRKIVAEIKEFLYANYKIIEGNTQSWINDPEGQLPELDWRVLYLFAREIYKQSQQSSINPDHYYTEFEAKKAQQYDGYLTVEDDVKLPLVFNEVTELGFGKYLTHINAKLLAQMSSVLLNYNFDIQREAKKTIKNNETIKEATLVMENVLEIKNHLKKNTLQPTMIVFNAAVGTADDGDEVLYNHETKQLQINKGTIIDIVDGYHRCKGSELALNENPDIDFKFALTILNYTDEQAAQYQGQLAEATPISAPKRKQLSAKRNSDMVVKELMNGSELKDRVAIAHRPNLKNKELVAYETLSDTIDTYFDLKRRIDIHKVGEYLKEYFDILLGVYEEEFINNPLKLKRTSVMVENKMFIGYLILASRMYEQGIEPDRVIKYIEQIDFDKDNILWQEIGFLDDKLRMTDGKTSKKAVENFFSNIEL